MKLVSVLVACLLSVFSIGGYAEQCPAVNCDCSAFPEGTWRARCELGETEVKASCVRNKGMPNQFCGLHGPEATPLALQLKLDAAYALKDELAVKAAKRQLIIIHWSIRDDFATVQEKIAQKDFASASQVIKLLNTNIDRVFENQRRITVTLTEIKSERAAKSEWKSFTKQMARTRKDIEKYSESLWRSFENAAEPQSRADYRRMGLRVLNVAGKVSEMLAYAYGEAGIHGKAAKIWRESAQISKGFAAKMSDKPKKEHIEYYKHQSAARWNRASYHWAMIKDETKSLEAHNSGREFIGRDPVEPPAVSPEEAAAEEERSARKRSPSRRLKK